MTLFGGAAVPAFARNNVLSSSTLALAGGSGVNSKRISIKGGVFRLMAGGKEVTAIEDRYLDIVIVKAAEKVSRVFYAESFDSDAAAAPPDCSSADGEKPDAHIKNKPAANCMTCPNNIAGSGKGNSRACRYQQYLAVVLANDLEGEVMKLTLPSTSIFGKEEGDKRPLQAYARYLAVQNPPVSVEQIVTRMRFDTKAESPKLFFQPMRWLTDDEYVEVTAQAETPEAMQAVTLTVAQSDGVKAAPLALEGKPLNNAKPAPAPVVEDEEEEAPPPAPKAKKAKPAPAPVVEDEDEEEAPPPAPKAKKAKPAPAPVVEEETEAEPEMRKPAAKASAVPAAQTKLASIVSDWDDE